MIDLHVQPAVPPMSWEDFTSTKPGFSIALDGYVAGAPRFAGVGPYANFNHHEGVDRLATRSTCAQVHLAIRQGLFSCFRDTCGAKANVYANDCDQDVCLSWYLLKNHYRAEPTMNALLNRLVAIEDMLDATAGAYPFPEDMPLLQEVAWIFRPYTQARAAGWLDSRDPREFEIVIDNVCDHIDRHMLGQGHRTLLDTRYKVLIEGDGYTVVEEIGAHARTGMFAHGVKAFVSCRKRADGNWNHVLGRMSQFIPFFVPSFVEALNEAEGLTEKADRWGGGDTIIGSARIAGSKLDPHGVNEVVKTTLSKTRIAL